MQQENDEKIPPKSQSQDPVAVYRKNKDSQMKDKYKGENEKIDSRKTMVEHCTSGITSNTSRPKWLLDV